MHTYVQRLDSFTIPLRVGGCVDHPCLQMHVGMWVSAN